MTGTPSRTARVPIVRWDLKEAEGKILTRGTRIACEASCRGARTRRCPKPSVIRNGPVYIYAAGMEGRSRVLPWEICVLASCEGCLPRGSPMGAQKSAEGRRVVAATRGPNK